MLPEILNTWFKIDEKKLWKLDLPVEEMLISELENNLDILYLEKEWTDDRNLSTRMLLQNFKEENSHSKRVNDADLFYPIEIYFHKWEWIILDWVHRYTKALINWSKKIKVRKITKEIALKVKR